VQTERCGTGGKILPENIPGEGKGQGYGRKHPQLRFTNIFIPECKLLINKSKQIIRERGMVAYHEG
jgi:hypothetical protein